MRKVRSGRARVFGSLASIGAPIALALTLTACGGGGGTTTGEATSTAGGETAEAQAGAQVFASSGCGSCHTFKAAGSTGATGPDLDEYLEPDDNKLGIEEMIVDPNAEVAEGYSADIMPQDFGEELNSEELRQLIAFLYVNSPASEAPTGELGEEERGR